MAAKLVSMKVDAKARDKAQEAMTMPAGDVPSYPWGLQLNLGNDELEKLGLEDLPDADTEIMIIAKAKVTSARVEDTTGGKSRSLSLQVTDICLEDAGEYSTSDAEVLFKKK